jgi:hypothetical protein
MTINPATIALLAGSMLVSALLLYASYYAVRILLRWDLQSGSEAQLALERRTYLVSTILAYALGFEILSLFLFVFTAERLHTLFAGAMCAAGTLYVNPYGYPALLANLATAVLAGVWLVINHADNTAWDYPLIRRKYIFLLLLIPVALAGAVLQGLYLTNLRADVITSCCGSLFGSSEAARSRDQILSFTGAPWGLLMYTLTGGSILAALVVYKTGRGAAVLGLLGLAAFVASLMGVIVYVSPYIYELPNHRCPFCLLQGDYHYIGYLIYASLLGGAVSSVSAGILGIVRRTESLRQSLPRIRRRLALTVVICYGILTVVVLLSILSSNLVIN